MNMDNSTHFPSTFDGDFLAIGFTSAAILVAASLVAVTLYLVFRWRSKHRPSPSTKKPPLSPKRRNYRKGSFRDKPHDTARFGIKNYMNMIGWGSTAQSEDNDTLYATPCPRGQKRKLSNIEDSLDYCENRLKHAKLFIEACKDKGSSPDSEIRFPSVDTVSEDSESLTNVSLVSDDSSDFGYSPHRDHSSLPVNFLTMSELFADMLTNYTVTDDINPQTAPSVAIDTEGEILIDQMKQKCLPMSINERSLSRYLVRLRRSRPRCSLAYIPRTWSFRSLLEQWRKYCESARQEKSFSTC